MARGAEGGRPQCNDPRRGAEAGGEALAPLLWESALRCVDMDAADINPLGGMRLLNGSELTVPAVVGSQCLIKALPEGALSGDRRPNSPILATFTPMWSRRPRASAPASLLHTGVAAYKSAQQKRGDTVGHPLSKLHNHYYYVGF